MEHSKNVLPLTLAYALPRYSSTATSMETSSVAMTTPLVIFPCLTVGTYLGNGDLFLLICHLSLAGARVFPVMEFMQVSTILLLYFQVMIHAHVSRYFFVYTHLLPTVIFEL